MGTTLMVVAGFCGLNEVLFLVSSHFGMPTAIAGLERFRFRFVHIQRC